MNKSILKFAAALTLLLALPLAATADDKANQVRESVQISDHFTFPPTNPPNMVNGATILIRDFTAGVITATVTSAMLEPHYAYSIWWVVFNRPENCTVPKQCGLVDLSNDAVKPSVFWGGGVIADGDGYGTTQLELRRGRTDRELFANTPDYGLQNLKGAEIHLVLRSHGVVGMAGTTATQLGTANQACPPAPVGCKNVFFSVHTP